MTIWTVFVTRELRFVPRIKHYHDNLVFPPHNPWVDNNKLLLIRGVHQRDVYNHYWLNVIFLPRLCTCANKWIPNLQGYITKIYGSIRALSEPYRTSLYDRYIFVTIFTLWSGRKISGSIQRSPFYYYQKVSLLLLPRTYKSFGIPPVQGDCQIFLQ